MGGEIRSLTGLRWLAATLVFLYHAYGLHADPSHYGQFPLMLWQVGWSGVPIFFTLSGFLLTFIYWDSFSKGISWQQLRDFAVKRFARLYPLYYLLLLIGFLRSGFNRQTMEFVGLDLWNFVSHVFMVHGFFDEHAASYIPAAWSLTVEEGFYLLLPFLILSMAWTRRFLKGWGPALLMWNGGLIAVGFLFVRWEIPGFMTGWVTCTVLGQIPTLSVGVALALLLKLYVPPSWRERRWLGNLVGILALALFTAAAWRFSHQVSWMEGFEGQLWFAPIAGLLILALWGRSFLTDILSAKWIVYGGRISYAFYLIQTLAMTTLRQLSLPIAVQYLVLLLLSAILYELIEKPCQHWLRSRWLGQRISSSHSVPKSDLPSASHAEMV